MVVVIGQRMPQHRCSTITYRWPLMDQTVQIKVTRTRR